MKIASAIRTEATYSEEDLLRIENEFLRDELEIQELMHSIELMETIKDCIAKEGGVSSSIEVMFGENFSSKENTAKELDEQINLACESAFNKVLEAAKNESVKAAFFSMVDKIKSITKDDLKNVQFPLTITMSRRVGQLDALVSAFEKTMEFSKKITAEDYKANAEAIDAEGMKIAEAGINAAKEAKEESFEVPSADEFMEFVSHTADFVSEFKTKWAEFQKSMWDLVKKQSQIHGEGDPTKETNSRNGMIRGLLVVYRSMLRIAMRSGRAILTAIGKK